MNYQGGSAVLTLSTSFWFRYNIKEGGVFEPTQKLQLLCCSERDIWDSVIRYSEEEFKSTQDFKLLLKKRHAHPHFGCVWRGCVKSPLETSRFVLLFFLCWEGCRKVRCGSQINLVVECWAASRRCNVSAWCSFWLTLVLAHASGASWRMRCALLASQWFQKASYYIRTSYYIRICNLHCRITVSVSLNILIYIRSCTMNILFQRTVEKVPTCVTELMNTPLRCTLQAPRSEKASTRHPCVPLVFHNSEQVLCISRYILHTRASVVITSGRPC